MTTTTNPTPAWSKAKRFAVIAACVIAAPFFTGFLFAAAENLFVKGEKFFSDVTNISLASAGQEFTQQPANREFDSAAACVAHGDCEKRQPPHRTLLDQLREDISK